MERTMHSSLYKTTRVGKSTEMGSRLALPGLENRRESGYEHMGGTVCFGVMEGPENGQGW